MMNMCISITETLDDEIRKLMVIEGYISRSEFIRFVIKFYKYHTDRNHRPPQEIQDGYRRGKKAEMRREIQACKDDYDG